MFEGSIPSLAGANSNGEKLERTFVKHSKKVEVPIRTTSRHRSSSTLPTQLVAAGESAAAGGPRCKKNYV